MTKWPPPIIVCCCNSNLVIFNRISSKFHIQIASIKLSFKFKYLVSKAAVLSKEVVLLLLIYCLMYFPLFVGVLCLALFCYALLCVHSKFAIILKRKRKLVTLLLLPYRCIVTINVLLLVLVVPWVVLQYVIVVFPDHTNKLYFLQTITKMADKLAATYHCPLFWSL